MEEMMATPIYGRRKEKVIVTAAEMRIWTFINSWMREKKYAPSIDEIAAAMNYSSNTFVARVIEELDCKGALIKVPRLARAISIPSNIRLVTRSKKKIKLPPARRGELIEWS